MGMNPHGTLFYGLTFNASDAWDTDEKTYDQKQAEFDLLEESIEKLDDLISAAQDAAVAHLKPSEDWSRERVDSDPLIADQWNAYQAAITAWNLDNCDTRTIGCSEHDGSRMALFIGSSFYDVEWDETQEITSLAVGPDWDAKLKAVVEAAGLPWSQPKWLLASRFI